MRDSDEETQRRPSNVLRRMMKQMPSSTETTHMGNGQTAVVGIDGRGEDIRDACETRDDVAIYTRYEGDQNHDVGAGTGCVSWRAR